MYVLGVFASLARRAHRKISKELVLLAAPDFGAGEQYRVIDRGPRPGRPSRYALCKDYGETLVACSKLSSIG